PVPVAAPPEPALRRSAVGRLPRRLPYAQPDRRRAPPRVLVDRRGPRRPRTPRRRPLLGRPPRPPHHPPVGHRGLGLRPPPRGHGVAPPLLRPHRPVHLAGPHHLRVARGRCRHLRLFQQRPGRRRRPQRPHPPPPGHQ